jgi:hypothetical protein
MAAQFTVSSAYTNMPLPMSSEQQPVILKFSIDFETGTSSRQRPK